MIAKTSALPSSSFRVAIRYPPSNGIHAMFNTVMPMFRVTFVRCSAGTVMNQRKVAITPSANIAGVAASPRKYAPAIISTPATSPTSVAGWLWAFTMTPNSSP